MVLDNLTDAQEAWIKRLSRYWTNNPKKFITRVGEIYEVDFGENPGTELSGRHLAICLINTQPSQERVLVIPISTKFEIYNISREDIVDVPALNVERRILGGVVLTEAKWVSKLRIFQVSKILEEPDNILNIVKGRVNIDTQTLKRWKKL